MRKWLSRHPFLLLGVATLLLFFIAEMLRVQGAVEASQMLGVPLRILIIPMYIVWLGFVMLNVAEGVAGPLGMVLYAVQLLCGLAPYMVGDYLLRRWRDPLSRRHLDA